MNDDRSHEIANELRRIRDALEVIATVLIVGVGWWMLFSGQFFPKPEGLWKFGAWVAPFVLASTAVKGIRSVR